MSYGFQMWTNTETRFIIIVDRDPFCSGTVSRAFANCGSELLLMTILRIYFAGWESLCWTRIVPIRLASLLIRGFILGMAQSIVPHRQGEPRPLEATHKALLSKPLVRQDSKYIKLEVWTSIAASYAVKICREIGVRLLSLVKYLKRLNPAVSNISDPRQLLLLLLRNLTPKVCISFSLLCS